MQHAWPALYGVPVAASAARGGVLGLLRKRWLRARTGHTEQLPDRGSLHNVYKLQRTIFIRDNHFQGARKSAPIANFPYLEGR